MRLRLLLVFALVGASWSADATTADTRLIDAVKHGELDAIRRLVSDRALVNRPATDGATPLHWAVHRDDLAAATLLLEAGANPNTANDLEVTPLWLACENGSASMVRRLLQAGADSNGPSAKFRPLMMCARTGNVDAVRALLAHKADVKAREPVRQQTALMWAVAQQHAEIVRVLLEHRADVHARSRFTRAVINRANPNDIYTAVVGPVSLGGGTPLLFAARSGDVASARLLLASGAKVDDLMPDGTSALTVAAHSNHVEMVRALLVAGANPNVIGSGYTALHAAVLRGNLEMTRALVAGGANIDSRLRHGTPTLRGSQAYFLSESLVGATPLWLAARFLELDIVQWLLERGASTAATLGDGTTMLMAAAGVGSQTRLFDRRDRAALLRESDESKALSVIRLLLEHGSEVNATNTLGQTALHGAAAMGYPEVARLLVARGAGIEARTKKGETPMAVATNDAVRRVLQDLAARRR